MMQMPSSHAGENSECWYRLRIGLSGPTGDVRLPKRPPGALCNASLGMTVSYV